ncbi:MAG TPA: protein-L-isoaspartate(D-aspartate) O-methyltransferase [Tenuifilaceae bacterium]|nr:protein-L-isoaspartate(D-aspartate) O-methyltransferase [Tenuifilaceae bacterium]HPC68707.1 protein-L-isoaspartate(D-aspartate) O-methyltransferase [Tenuifilaceae bacterium]HRS45893.1 protein-L-isoaspartate(D-aspartate) O-methyltransferase [Tenuifilaceae bacterium]HRV12117.1 protein-L-isoaspartate(D-aspartate) O-methyltransferase [Tenuifilaceae bacterium]
MRRLLLPFMLMIPVKLALAQASDEYVSRRMNMVLTQITQRGVVHRATIKAMETVPRHLFVPNSYRNSAYEDRPLPIGYGQTISQPYIVAYMTELMKPSPEMIALEIGTGSGYQAAVLAEIVKHVYTIEIVPQLGSSAEKTLRKLDYSNVTTRIADGYHGWPEKGPFDIIVVTAAADHIPPPLIEQLKEGGRMIIPVGSPFLVQQLMLVEKKGGKVKTRSLILVRFVPFTRAEE